MQGVRYRTDRMQDNRDARQDGCRKGGMQERKDAGKEGCGKGRMQKGGMKKRRVQTRKDKEQEIC